MIKTIFINSIKEIVDRFGLTIVRKKFIDFDQNFKI